MTGSLALVSPAVPQGPALARTPPCPAPDPWQRVLTPALRGQRRAFFAAVDALEAEDARHPSLAELTARGLFALGLERAALQSLDLALTGGLPSAFSLAALALPEPEATARLGGWLQELPPAAQADLRCDLAARALLRSDLAGAQAQIDAALCTSPQHAETRRWHRLITDARGRACPRTDARERGALLPRAAGGWISEERWLRRITGGWSRPAAPESGLGRPRPSARRAVCWPRMRTTRSLTATIPWYAPNTTSTRRSAWIARAAMPAPPPWTPGRPPRGWTWRPCTTAAAGWWPWGCATPTPPPLGWWRWICFGACTPTPPCGWPMRPGCAP